MTTTDPAGANGAKPRGRDAARTREMVLAGAMAEFTAKGFAGARIDAVAERAGVNVRAIYQHFESKAALFDAVVGDSVHRRHERLLTDMAGLFDVRDGLAEVLPLFRRVLGDHPGWVRLMAWKELSEDPDAGAADIASGADRQPLYRREIALLDAARERGQIPAGLDSDLLLIALTALASFPWFVRPLTLLVTEQSPESPEFLARWDAFLLAMGRALVGAEAGGVRPGSSPAVAAPHRHRELRMLGRALDRAGLAGPFGHCSLRVDAETFLVTPPHPLRVLGTRPCVVAPVHGPLPEAVLPEVRLDQAVYRARPDVGAIATITPASVDALARTGRSIAARDPHAAYFGAGPGSPRRTRVARGRRGRRRAGRRARRGRRPRAPGRGGRGGGDGGAGPRARGLPRPGRSGCAAQGARSAHRRAAAGRELGRPARRTRVGVRHRR